VIKIGPRLLSPWESLLLITGALLVLRVALLLASPFNLGPDEAQYWSWSLEPAFGYFSKPPMIAWLIGASTFLFGHEEWAVRLTSPFVHGLTSLVIYQIGARLYDPRIGFWSAITFATLPSVFFSSGLITTDTPLLFFWSVALLSFVNLERGGGTRWAVALGLGIGFGMMSKYAMVYFILCSALYLVFNKNRMTFLGRPGFYLAFVVAGFVVLPNILWNMTSGFATLTHTASNANWQGDMFNPGRMFEFLGGQLGVFGPILFPAFLVGAFLTVRGSKNETWPADRLLLFFCLPILAVATTQGFLSRANANWAATTYIAATLFTVSFLLRSSWPKLMAGSLALHLGIAGFFYALVVIPGTIEATGMSNAFKRVRGWDVIGGIVLSKAEATPFTAIMGDDRLITAELLYYVRPRTLPITYWDADLHPIHHYELKIPLRFDQGGRVLLVSRYKEPRDMFEHFETTRFLETVRVVTGDGKVQKVHLFELTGYKGRGHDAPRGDTDGT
jgi:4-amino-4-deoxy-L-arabinose transferase-like glycosyltransferase